MAEHKSLEQIKNLSAGSYKVGIYSSFGCIACEGYVEREKDNVDYFVNLADETDINFQSYEFLPPVIPSIITIDK